MSEQTKQPEREYDLSPELASRFRLACEAVVEEIITDLELYEIESDGKGYYAPDRFEVARFDRRKKDERKIEKNIRKFLAHATADHFDQVESYVPELDPYVVYLPVASLEVPPKDHKGGYTISLIRMAEADLEILADGRVRPNTVTYSLVLDPVTDPSRYQRPATLYEAHLASIR